MLDFLCINTNIFRSRSRSKERKTADKPKKTSPPPKKEKEEKGYNVSLSIFLSFYVKTIMVLLYSLNSSFIESFIYCLITQIIVFSYITDL